MAENQGVILGYIFLFRSEPTCHKVVPLANTISDGMMTETISENETHTHTGTHREKSFGVLELGVNAGCLSVAKCCKATP